MSQRYHLKTPSVSAKVLITNPMFTKSKLDACLIVEDIAPHEQDCGSCKSLLIRTLEEVGTIG